ncbi:hypothetical protein [Limnoglobus roseus]|uniref:DUF3575 domain-containing protein n=1 Tax=Limnoglobus roseus TaxID=2598579 RepID=A0A5C1ADL4_9BACT|nr:hypothetical protein [Limnoglobus roseus]QEL15204.1 hypothetical protein PX52LOC_02119 [Limnoglobus roseus]
MPFRLAATLTVLLLASIRGPAQDVLLEALDRQPQPVYAADGLLATEKPREVINPGRWRTDIVFGLPIALRVQRQITDAGLWAEGGVALYGFIPSVFVGARFDGRIFEGRRNSWYARPGVDVYYSPIHDSGSWLSRPFNSIGAITVDSDLSWQHKWSEQVHSNIGLKVGMGVAFAGRNVWPVPILGLTCGLQY